MPKFVFDAGHSLITSGKECMASIDPNRTKEWALTSRDFDKLQKLLEAYEDVQVLRVDDVTGKYDVPLADRVAKANNWGADLYLSNHRNAGINGGTGGGIVVYRHPQSSQASAVYQEAIYKHLIATTGLKGNRSNPTAEADFYVLRNTRMPAILVEGGFMDSRTDTPIILTQEYTDKVVQAYLNFLVEQFKLVKKPVIVAPPAPVYKPLPEGTLLRVCVGTFGDRGNAVEMQEFLASKGIDSFLAVYKVV